MQLVGACMRLGQHECVAGVWLVLRRLVVRWYMSMQMLARPGLGSELGALVRCWICSGLGVCLQLAGCNRLHSAPLLASESG